LTINPKRRNLSSYLFPQSRKNLNSFKRNLSAKAKMTSEKIKGIFKKTKAKLSKMPSLINRTRRKRRIFEVWEMVEEAFYFN
jgi:hypothetical protein